MAEFSQKQYMEDVAQIMAVRARGPQPMAFVHTYGCQQNVADGEKIKGQLEEMGFGFTTLFCSTPVQSANMPRTGCSAMWVL